MAVITFPNDLRVSTMRWEQQRREIANESPFGNQSQEVTGPVWAASIEVDRMSEFQSGRWKALTMQLRGRTHILAMWDLGRPVPRGTIRGAMALASDAAQGATSIQIAAAGEAGKTLVQGDLLGLGSGLTQQVIMIVEDAVSDAGGLITVNFEAPLRNAFPAGAAVQWDKPKALFRRQNPVAGWDYESSLVRGFRLDLLEDWRV